MAPGTTPALRLVLADNDENALALVEMDLQLAGHEVVGTALQGDEAIALCQQLAPDVLVTDYRMPPGPNGLEVARTVLAQDDPPRVIIYTNYRDAAIQHDARNIGAEVLPKGNIRALRRMVGR